MLRRMTGKGLSTKNVLGRGRGRARTAEVDELEEMYNLTKLPEGDRAKIKNLLKILISSKACSRSKDLDEAIGVVINAACDILQCDRATLFIVDDIREELVIRQGVGVDEIRIPWDAGLAGTVFKTNQKSNVPNAYKNSLFSPETDKKTGYKTVSLLTLPIHGSESGEPVAVLQCVNKLEAGVSAGGSGSKFCPFSEDDEMLAEHLAMQVGTVLSNHLLNEKNKRAHNQVLALLDIVKSLHSNMGINSLMFTITERTPTLVDADRCTLYLVDRARNELWSLQGAVEVRVPMGKGLAGTSAETGTTLNIEGVFVNA